MQAPLTLRWMKPNDLPEVLAIERESFPVPWTEEEFRAAGRCRTVISLVAESRGRVVGYLIYEMRKGYQQLMSMAVARIWRGNGIGRTMLAKLKNKLREQRREYVACYINERSLDAQLFFRSCGFRCIPDLCEFESGEWYFEWRLYGWSDPLPKFQWRNRISESVGNGN